MVIERYRFVFQARESFAWEGFPGNTIRGALGHFLRGSEGYEELFAPRQDGGPSGLRTPPRPFVLRVGHLVGKRVEAGEQFHFDLHLFQTRRGWGVLVEDAFRRWERFGVLMDVGREEVALDLRPSGETADWRVEFVTPTELKWQGSVADGVPFAALLARARDRVSAVSACYGSPVELDWKHLGEQADGIRMLGSELQREWFERRSSRTGEVHELSGWRGWAVYEQVSPECAAVLRACEWLGVGRQTVWGKGEIRCATVERVAAR